VRLGQRHGQRPKIIGQRLPALPETPPIVKLAAQFQEIGR
jgi:hypothetical protein